MPFIFTPFISYKTPMQDVVPSAVSAAVSIDTII